MNQSGTALRERSNRLPPSANASSTASFKAISVIGPGVASSSLSYSGLKPEYPSEWGYSYYRIEQQGEAWTYLLTVSGSNWRNKPYGYHAPGYLVCESCSSAGKGWGGLYHFSDQAKSQPATAAERAELRNEWVGYPYIQLGPEHLEHYGSREGIRLGPLTVYAVLYRFVVKEGRGMFVDILAAQEGGLLVVHLTDGCVSFETTILLQSGSGRDP